MSTELTNLVVNIIKSKLKFKIVCNFYKEKTKIL